MNLLELKIFADRAIENARGFGEDPKGIPVSIQINKTKSETLWTGDVELTYDNDGQASGCVLHGWTADDPDEKQLKILRRGLRYDWLFFR